MSRVLPILFNANMVKAILDGRKTVTRRVIKVPKYYPYFYKLHDNTDGALTGTKDRLFAGFYNEEKVFYTDGIRYVDAIYYQSPYRPGDILYVRETWCWRPCWCCGFDADEHTCSNCRASKIYNHEKVEWGCYGYKASFGDNEFPSADTWHPSIHMPKSVARIWLRVTDVRVERLQEITEEQAEKEGAINNICFIHSPGDEYANIHTAKEDFENIWNSTIKKTDLVRYGWGANPWVWVIEFERCEKPESEGQLINKKLIKNEQEATGTIEEYKEAVKKLKTAEEVIRKLLCSEYVSSCQFCIYDEDKDVMLGAVVVGAAKMLNGTRGIFDGNIEAGGGKRL